MKAELKARLINLNKNPVPPGYEKVPWPVPGLPPFPLDGKSVDIAPLLPIEKRVREALSDLHIDLKIWLEFKDAHLYTIRPIERHER